MAFIVSTVAAATILLRCGAEDWGFQRGETVFLPISGASVKVTDEDRRRGVPFDRLECPTTAGCVISTLDCEPSSFDSATASSVTVITAGVRYTVHGANWASVVYKSQDECNAVYKQETGIFQKDGILVVGPSLASLLNFDTLMCQDWKHTLPDRPYRLARKHEQAPCDLCFLYRSCFYSCPNPSRGACDHAAAPGGR